MKTLEGKRFKCATGSEDQALPLKRSWSLSTPLFSWLGFKEVTYFSASALSPRCQTQPFRGGNERLMRKLARDACSECLWNFKSFLTILEAPKSEFHLPVAPLLGLEVSQPRNSTCPVDIPDCWIYHIYHAAFFSKPTSPLRENQTHLLLFGETK